MSATIRRFGRGATAAALVMLATLATPSSIVAQRTSAASSGQFTVYPTFISRPETGFGAGMGAAYESGRTRSGRPRKALSGEGILAAHGRGAINLGAGVTDATGRQRIALWTNASTLPARFDGIGRDANAGREIYQPRVEEAGVTYQRTIWRALSVGPIYTWRRTTIDAAPSGVLASPSVIGNRGGTTMAAGGMLSWDTRSGTIAPSLGSLLQITASRSGSWAGGDFAFDRLVADARKYVPLAPATVIALQLLGDFTRGQVPFDQLAMSGESGVMRAYDAGKIRDGNLVDAQAELQLRPWSRLGLVAFGGAGTVAEHPEMLRARDLLPSIGWGVRLHPRGSDRLIVRVDRGYGRGTTATTIGIGEAF